MPLGVPKRVWIFAAVALLFAINAGWMMRGGSMFPGLSMRSDVALANVVIDDLDKLTRTTTLMVPTLRFSGEVTNNGAGEIWQIEFDADLYACPKGGGESLDDCSLAKDVSVLASVVVPPGVTRPFTATGYLSLKDLPIGEAVRRTTELRGAHTH